MESKPRKKYILPNSEDNSFARSFVKTVAVLGGLGCLVFFITGLAHSPAQTVPIGDAKPAQFFGKPKKATSGAIDSLHAQARSARENNDLLKAKTLYQQLIAENPQYSNISEAQKELGDLNIQIIMSNLETPQTMEYEIKSGDSLVKIAKKNATTVDLLKASNNLQDHVIRTGEKLRIWNAPFSIFVSKAQNVLVLKAGEEVIKVYSVATGANSITPVGEYTITNKMEHPVWFRKGVAIPPESPENALGTRWMGFNLPQYGIHGTIEPQLIGKQVSHGCVRMRNEEVEELYNLIPLGTKVTITE